jgi:hypothetical protein
VQTNASGEFVFPLLGAGTWQVQPQKMGDAGDAITSLDAAYVLQAAAGLRLLTAQQQLACDVSGDHALGADDAALILQHKVGLIGSFPVSHACESDWVFVPVPAAVPNQLLVSPQVAAGSCQHGTITFDPLASQADHQDFAAVLFGDCTGNWRPSGAAPGVSGNGAAVHLGRMRPAQQPGHVRVPLYVQTAETFYALDAQVAYDPDELTALGIRRLGDARRALVQTNPQVPGVLAVALASGEPLHSGALFVLEFERHGSRNRTTGVRIVRAAVGEH